MRVVYFVAASLDGRISGPNHDLTFLETLSSNAGDHGYEEFFAAVDGLVLGANTWDFLAGHTWPYGDKPTWVVTHRPELAPKEGANVRAFSGNVADLVEVLEGAGLQRVWLVGGGSVAGQFLAVDRLDEVILTLAPTFVGPGPALVDGNFPLHRFRLVSFGRAEDTEGLTLKYERATD